MIGAAMRIVKVGVLAPTNKGIPLGVQGENRATEVEFDTRPWFREYPSGTVSAVARRDGDHAPYPLSLDVVDGTAVWQVSDTDTAKAGEGAVELTMTSGGARVRSLTFKTLVTASLTDAPVDDDAWYGWLDKAVVKVDETVQSAQRKMDEVDAEWTDLKSDVTAKVEECGEAAAQAASDAHHAKVDAQATAKALESAEGSVAKAEAAATRAEGAAEQAYGAARQASVSAGNASDAASDAREALAQAAGWADMADKSATSAAESEANAARSASSAADSAERATAQKVAAENAKDAAEAFKAGAEAAKAEAAASASNAAESATAAAKSASDAAASVDAINVIAPKTVVVGATGPASSVTIGGNAKCLIDNCCVIGRGANATVDAPNSVSIGESSIVDANSAICIGVNSRASHVNSIAIGTNAATKKPREVSFGVPATDSNIEYTREITHVSEPTEPTSASTKKYTDDNDTKTLNEAKKYTDANTSNALVDTVSGKLLHVEDAWPSEPLGLTIDGACKQDGTPSPENPVPITVIENPTLHVTGRNIVNVPATTVEANSVGVTFPCGLIPSGTEAFLSFVSSNDADPVAVSGGAWGLFDYTETLTAYTLYPSSIKAGINRASLTTNFDATKHFAIYGYRKSDVSFDISNYQLEVGGYHDYRAYTSATIPITLPAEHPYLAALPNGMRDEIVIDKDGNASLVARVGVDRDVTNIGYVSVGEYYEIVTNLPQFSSVYELVTDLAICSAIPSIDSTNTGIYRTFDTVYVKYSTQETKEELQAQMDKVAPLTVAAAIPPKTYQLGKLDIPSLPETISNVWTDAELTTNMSMTYKRDINIAFDNLVQAVVAAAAGE